MRYSEVLLRGPQGWTQGYVAGYLRGAGAAGAVYDAEREGFDCAPIRERLHDAFDRDAGTVHLLAPEEAEPALRAAVAAAAGEFPQLAIEGSRALRGACFAFVFTIYSPDHAAVIHRDFAHPPPGARLRPGARFEEKRHPEAAGPELKGPEHAYALEGEGEIEGDVPAVLALYRRYRNEELVRVQRLRLLSADVEP